MLVVLTGFEVREVVQLAFYEMQTAPHIYPSSSHGRLLRLLHHEAEQLAQQLMIFDAAYVADPAERGETRPVAHAYQPWLA